MLKSFTVLISVILFFFGCYESGLRGSGIISSEERTFPAFQEIRIGGAYKVNVYFSKDYKIDISGDDNIIQHIRTDVKGKTLHINNDKSIHSYSDVTLNIYTHSLKKISLSGACNIIIPDIKEESFIAEASGAGKINLSGKVKNLSVVLSGACNIDAKNLSAYNAKVNISGAGNVNLYVVNELDASVSGVGSVNYYGEPKSVKKNVSGVGSVKKRD